MASTKITINNLRPEKGGDPDKYRKALLASNPTTPGETSSSSDLVDQALQHDTERRSAQTSLEQLRHQVSDLQTNVIAPKKKAGEVVPPETIEQLKQWKVDIGRLSAEAKELEKKRNDVLCKINELISGVSIEEEDTKGASHCPVSNNGAAGGESNTKDITKNIASNGIQVLKRPPTSQEQTPSTQTQCEQVTEPTLPILSPEQIKTIPPERILNLNVGVLGHVDTGKTSLVKTLSSVLSTASLDKSKQSRARGITLDLGFSAFLLPLPDHLKKELVGDTNDGIDDDKNKKQRQQHEQQQPQNQQKSEMQQKYDLLQVTLVDCPGHASLIRTIIGGAQIIDMVLLVVDATKGMQTQTAECLVIAEMTTRNLIVVLNKVDLFPENEREERIRLAEKKMKSALRGTKFENATMIGISACVGGEKVAAIGGIDGSSSHLSGTHNIHGLLNVLQSHMRAPNRDGKPSPDRFHFAVDHCFPIKGQGTVLTGTCLSGSARPNDMVEFPTLATQKKIKGLQMFRRKANIIQQGDRAGICVSNFDAKLMERGIIASPGTVRLIRGAIAVVRKVRFFKGALHSGAKFHISVGHTTVMASVTFWGAREIAEQAEKETEIQEVTFATNKKNNQQITLGNSSLGGSADLAGLPRLKFDWNQDFLHQDDYLDSLPSENSGGKAKIDTDSLPPLHWARIEFQTPVYCPMDSLVIGSRLDTEVNANACRLAFSGRLVARYDAKTVGFVSDDKRLRTYTKKEKVGHVCRLGDPHRRNDDNAVVRYEVFGTDLFKKETNMSQFVGLLVETDTGDIGSIQSSFGTSGKFRVNFPAGTCVREGGPLYLRFKRYANDPRKAIHQDTKLPPARAGLRIDPPAKKKKNKQKNGIQKEDTTVQSTTVIAENEERLGDIEKLKGDLVNGKHTVAIISGLFSMEDDISKHKGRKVISLATEEEGAIDGSFGKMGKCKVSFKEGISAEAGSRVKMLPFS